MTGGLVNAASGTNIRIANNDGYRTRNSGIAMIPTGASSASILHGLDSPGAKVTVMLWPVLDIAGAGAARFWGGLVTGGAFAAHADATLSNNLFFNWTATAEGG